MTDLLNKERRRLEQRRLNLRDKSLVHPIGFEPMTYGLENRCSIQLSYGCISKFWSRKGISKNGHLQQFAETNN